MHLNIVLNNGFKSSCMNSPAFCLHSSTNMTAATPEINKKRVTKRRAGFEGAAPPDVNSLRDSLGDGDAIAVTELKRF
jgi:hypothetical protein